MTTRRFEGKFTNYKCCSACNENDAIAIAKINAVFFIISIFIFYN